MKQDSASDEFRKQRMLEIIEEIFSAEQEAIIEKLTEINSVLKSEIQQTDLEKNKQVYYLQEEYSKVSKKGSEIEVMYEKEKEVKLFLEQECEKLSKKIEQTNEHNEELLKIKEAYLNQQS